MYVHSIHKYLYVYTCLIKKWDIIGTPKNIEEIKGIPLFDLILHWFDCFWGMLKPANVHAQRPWKVNHGGRRGWNHT